MAASISSPFPRKDPVTEDGMPIPPAMGTGTVFNFQPTGGRQSSDYRRLRDYCRRGRTAHPFAPRMASR